MFTVDKFFRVHDEFYGDGQKIDYNLIQIFANKIIDMLDIRMASIKIPESQKTKFVEFLNDDSKYQSMSMGFTLNFPISNTIREYVEKEYTTAGFEVESKIISENRTLFIFHINKELHKKFIRGVNNENKEIEEVTEGDKWFS